MWAVGGLCFLSRLLIALTCKSGLIIPFKMSFSQGTRSHSCRQALDVLLPHLLSRPALSYSAQRTLFSWLQVESVGLVTFPAPAPAPAPVRAPGSAIAFPLRILKTHFGTSEWLPTPTSHPPKSRLRASTPQLTFRLRTKWPSIGSYRKSQADFQFSAKLI